MSAPELDTRLHLRDETGKRSHGRILLERYSWTSVALIAAEVATRMASELFRDRLPAELVVPEPVWTFLGMVFPLLVLWVAVPRASASWGGILSGIASLTRKATPPEPPKPEPEGERPGGIA